MPVLPFFLFRLQNCMKEKRSSVVFIFFVILVFPTLNIFYPSIFLLSRSGKCTGWISSNIQAGVLGHSPVDWLPPISIFPSCQTQAGVLSFYTISIPGPVSGVWKVCILRTCWPARYLYIELPGLRPWCQQMGTGINVKSKFKASWKCTGTAKSTLNLPILTLFFKLQQ